MDDKINEKSKNHNSSAANMHRGADKKMADGNKMNEDKK